jgi:hypothetical protein
MSHTMYVCTQDVAAGRNFGVVLTNSLAFKRSEALTNEFALLNHILSPKAREYEYERLICFIN